ncbi:hypothetical protein BC943DRAFT_327396 [Umbelopsis sp. AD052]|nr:hypothetical protein BC943DRAFT_327396 [Umbelopsis sp. AD052]
MDRQGTGTLKVSWSDIVRRGKEMRIPSTLTRQREEKSTVNSASKVVYEAEGFENERRAHQAAAIIKRALHPNTVLFEIDATELSKNDVYDLITKEIGEATGFRPISEYRDAKKACSEGLIHEGINYVATPSIENAEKLLTKVTLTHLPLESQEEIKEGLLQSMEKYGQVCQIRLFTTARGHFEGEAAVLLDTSKKGEEHQAEELTRMIFLEKWDGYYPATFKGAPPVCFMCRHSGHVKKDCPEMAKILCYRCNEFGHMRRDCTSVKQQRRSHEKEPEDSEITRERIGKKRQRSDTPTSEGKREILNEVIEAVPAKTTVITIEDSHVDEDMCNEIWHGEPHQEERIFDDEEGDEMSVGEEEEEEIPLDEEEKEESEMATAADMAQRIIWQAA